MVYRDGFYWARTVRIKPNPWNPNVMDHNTLQMLKVNLQGGNYDPLIVSPARIFFGNKEQEATDYIVVDGEQRLIAAQGLNIEWLKVDVKHLTDSEAREECYSRGRVRGQLDPIKEGHLFDLELEEIGSEAAVAEKYKVSRSYVAGRRTLLRAPKVILELFKTPEKTYKKVVTKVHAAETKEAKKLVKKAQKDPEATPWAVQNARNRIPDKLDKEDLVPRGTLTASHVEALTALPAEDAVALSLSVMERDLSVRETERRVTNRKEEIEKEERFKKALEAAKSPTCPTCGSAPRGFSSYNEGAFKCDADPYSHNDWDYTKTPEQHRKKKARAESKKKEERSAQLSSARLNPAYTRRAEEVDELYDSMRPWILRQIKKLETVSRVSITGVRADGSVMKIDYPFGYGKSLSFQTSDGTEDGTLDWDTRKTLSFSMEAKKYKKLPFKTKLNCTATPEYRALVNHFLDYIINTDEDPTLPEDPEAVQAILIKYGEAEPEPVEAVCPICEKSEAECTCLEITKREYEMSEEAAEAEAAMAEGEDDARARAEAKERDQEDFEAEQEHSEGEGPPEGP